MVNDQAIINSYFEQCFSFGSLFILTKEDSEERFVAEIKSINDGLDQISFIPLDDEGLPFKAGDIVKYSNETGNITFEVEVAANHGGRWLTGALPRNLRMINLRQSERIKPTSAQLLKKTFITSYGEDGLKKKGRFDAELLDISETGVSLLVRARKLDGIFRSDEVEMNLSERLSFLAKIRGKVVHKSVAYSADKDKRFYKVGVKFKEKQNLSVLNS